MRTRPPDSARATGQAESYAMLAGAVLGRSVTLRADPSVPAAAWNDGVCIWINPAHALQAGVDMALAVMVQAALIRAGSLNWRGAAKLIGRPGLARRYLAVEAPRALLACANRLPRRLLAHPALAGGEALAQSPQHAWQIAAGTAPIAAPHPLLGALRPAAVMRAARSASAAGATAQAGTMKLVPRQSSGLDEDESRLLKLLSMLDLGGSPFGGLIGRLFGQAAQRTARQALAAGDAQAIDETPGHAHAPAGTAISRHRRHRQTVASPLPVTTWRYDEWDSARGCYRPGWTRVDDFVPGHAETGSDTACHAASAAIPPPRQMRRQLARLQLGLEGHRRQPAGDDIVLDDMIALEVRRRAGDHADPRIYRALRRTCRQLGVLLLLDSSASVQDSTRGGGTIHDHQRLLTQQIASTLEDAGDRVAIYGFNSWGRDRVQMMRAKSFDQRMGAATADRLSRLVPSGFTRMGAALRHAGRMVATQSGMPFRLVVLITDGISYDEGYERSYGEADTRRSIAELHALHIGCVCLSVGGEADAVALQRVFGDAAFLRADRLDSVTARLGGVFAQAVAAVSKH